MHKNATFKPAFKLSGTLLLMLVTAPAWAQEMEAVEETPSYVHIKQINYAGSGCPAGSVWKNVSSDKKAFTISFDQFIAEVGPGLPYGLKRKNCQITADLDFPEGWSFAILGVDYRGYALLERNVIGLQRANYYFQGERTSGSFSVQFVGPLDDNYHLRDSMEIESTVWSPCGLQRALNINTEVRLDNSRAPYKNGILTMDAVDGQIQQVYNLQWRRCS